MSKPQQQPVFQLPTSHGVVLKTPPQAPPRTFKSPIMHPTNNQGPPQPPVQQPMNNNPPQNSTTPSPSHSSSSPVINSINNSTLPPPSPKMISKLSPSPSPSGSPPVPRRPPPQPGQQLSNSGGLPPPPPNTVILPPPITSVNNLPPPIVHLPPPPPSTVTLPPPPIVITNNSMPPPPPPTMLNKPPQQSPNSTPTTPKRMSGVPPQFKPIANNNSNNNNSPQPITMLGSPLGSVPALKSLQQPPAFVKSNSLDPKTMSSYTHPQSGGVSGQLSFSTSASSLSPPMSSGSGNTSPLSHSGNSTPPPPPTNLLKEKRNSNGGLISGNNNRLSQDLNSMFQNRLTNGLSPPVSTPFYDEKVLSSASKAQELKEKRDNEEKERREREKTKKEKEEQEKRDKKEKKEKDEQEKKEKKKEEQEKKKKEEQEKKDKDKKKKDDDKKKSGNKLKGSGNVGPTPTIFNSTLDQIMEVQREKVVEYADLPYPAFLKIVTEGIINCNGCSTEGIFRVPGTTSEVNRIKKQMNEFDFTLTSDDPHVLAGLLKLWLRELTDPVIPTELYYDCIKSKSRDEVTRQVHNLPPINREVLFFILKFLKYVANPANTPKTKMDADNISMVFAPGLLRCPPNDPNMMLNTQYEKDFIKNLIDYLV
ncbi:RhoGAP domain-containing protein [Tieghemostelium lacteum]|uniref:RhoGAP domain-containing protein n=1 Tax=Tieghemostelium lacteum TaxID=361077 RepID=A0A152A8B7_TIELA|nr:RhoGAP domain-containing protein [Tieghemostelium lacteum]|eukprot:KYR02381.1 RhoGAP domain-containing protein [Tieghemostelium lacteum]